MCCSAAAPPVHFVKKKMEIFPLPLKTKCGVGKDRYQRNITDFSKKEIFLVK